MRTPDRIPETMKGEPFPYGDIELNPEADEWLAVIEEDDWDEFMDDIDRSFESYSSPNYLARLNHTLAKSLCEHWDESAGGEYALTGYKIAQRFLHESDVLPEPNAELRMALIQMKHENTAMDFARSAWHDMSAQHPRVFAYHEKLFQYAENESELEIMENAEQFLAGLSLPYMLSVASRHATEAKESGFTSMVNSSEVKHDLRTTKFGTFFSKEAPLVEYTPAKRQKKKAKK
jgi:hypothetical protein